MWVHPDLVQNQQWTIVTNMKSRGKARTSTCNVVCASSREANTDIASLVDSEEERTVLAAVSSRGARSPLMTGTWSGQQYLKKYHEAVASSSKPAKEPVKQLMKQPVEK